MSKLFILETDRAFHLVEDEKIVLTEEKSVSLATVEHDEYRGGLKLGAWAHELSKDAQKATAKATGGSEDDPASKMAARALGHSSRGDHERAHKTHTSGHAGHLGDAELARTPEEKRLHLDAAAAHKKAADYHKMLMRA